MQFVHYSLGPNRSWGIVVDSWVLDPVELARPHAPDLAEALSRRGDVASTLHGALGPLSDIVAGIVEEGSPARGAPALVAPLDDVTLLAPVDRPSKIICVGLNYLEHIDEVGLARPARPAIFSKLPSALLGPGMPIPYPHGLSDQVDYEAELAIVIGRRARNVIEEEVEQYVLGFTVANDVTARDWQFSEDNQLTLGKGFDGFYPLGPTLVTWDGLGDPQQLRISTTVNDDVRQDSTTADMLFSVREIVAFVSTVCTLEPGDVISTGTPAGVAAGRDDSAFLRPGDVLRCSIDGIGELTNTLV